MLGKLLKYDFKAFLRIMLPFYLALIALSLLAGLSQSGQATTDVTSKTSPLITIWVIALLAVLTVNIIMVVQRFRDNLLKNEGYLMFTLPVTRWQLLVSKALPALVSLIISAFTLILSTLLLAVVSDGPEKLSEELSQLLQLITTRENRISVLLLVVLGALIIAFQQICLIYTVLLGSQILPRFRAVAALGAYILVTSVKVQITLGVMSLFPQETYTLLLGQGAIETVLAGLYFWLSGWLMCHTLNLE